MTVEALSTEALTTSEIEGEILDRPSVQSSIEKRLGLPAEKRCAAPAERGVSEMMANLYKTYATPLSDDMLFDWYRMLMSGRQDLMDIGCFRTRAEPIQIGSGAMGAAFILRHPIKKHFGGDEAVHQVVQPNRPRCPEPLPALTRAGAAHLCFESVHPFEDGNGRIGRALAEKSLAQSLG